MEKESKIFQSVSTNGQKYIEEMVGRLLNSSFLQLIEKAKKNGDFERFLKANKLEDEKVYHFIKTDEEPSSPMTRSDEEGNFEA